MYVVASSDFYYPPEGQVSTLSTLEGIINPNFTLYINHPVGGTLTLEHCWWIHSGNVEARFQVFRRLANGGPFGGDPGSTLRNRSKDWGLNKNR